MTFLTKMVLWLMLAICLPISLIGIASIVSCGFFPSNDPEYLDHCAIPGSDCMCTPDDFQFSIFMALIGLGVGLLSFLFLRKIGKRHFAEGRS